MWDTLYRFSTTRLSWFLMLLTATGLELTALYFQHILKLEPCVLCIYERVALFGLVGAALLGLCNPKNPVFRWSAIVLWMYSAWQGVMLAWEHNQLQVNPSPFQTCDFMVR
ncbi:MAG: disulfide bond formation protein DsbB, partial [Plesiomonas sp.]